MKYCNNCGAELNDTDKFCKKCGKKIQQEQVNNIPTVQKSDTYVVDKPSKKSSKNIVIIISVIIAAIILATTTYFIKTNNILKNQKLSIESIDSSSYPDVKVTIKATGFQHDLSTNNFSLKENDIFQNNLNLSKKDNTYTITYKTTNSSEKEQRNVNIQYDDGKKSFNLNSSYSSPKKDDNSSAGSYKSISTYDENESKVKDVINSYENSFIQMVNYRDYSYVENYIKGGSQIEKELQSIIKQYDAQKITESLEQYKIEEIKKVTDTQYKAVVYEKYSIQYGIKDETKLVDFRMTYILDNTDLGFKISSIKETKQLSSSKIN